jgi:hypothetical protein
MVMQTLHSQEETRPAGTPAPADRQRPFAPGKESPLAAAIAIG